MGEIYGPHKIEIFDEQDDYNVADLNENFKKLSDGTVQQIVLPGTGKGQLPEGKRLKRYNGFIGTRTGAGGNDRGASPATDANGVGGLWFGYGGLPAFEGIIYINIKEGNNVLHFQANYEVVDWNTTRIKYRGKKLAPDPGASLYTNAYGGLELFVEVLGW